MTVMIKALGHYSHKGGRAAGGIKTASAHLKYLEHGKVHLNKPRGFDANRDDLSRREFMEYLRLQPERGVIAHKLVFSLSQEERDRLGIDMKDLVRETMAGFEANTGRQLRWIGFEHDDPGHPHVHVVVAGYDKAGKQVGIYPRDLAALRQVAERERDRLAGLTRSTGLDRRDREDARLHVDKPHTLGKERTGGLLERVWEVLREVLERGRKREQDRLPIAANRGRGDDLDR